MQEGRLKYIFITIIIFSSAMCRKAYEPPEIRASNHFLAMDGVINTGANSSSSFIISRSLNLTDTVPNIPELNAQVFIQSSGGAMYPLIDSADNGNYISAPLNLDPGQKYQIAVTTKEGNKYLSDLVTPKISPPIDSITWQVVYDASTVNDALKIFVNAHDPSNNTRYYRWDYTETYQHHSEYQSYWYRDGDMIFPIDNASQSTYSCWSTENSTSILLGTSISLSADVISQAPIASFPKDDPRLDFRYSTLVRQFPLDQEAYNYWLTVQKNSQSLGGLFDLQPSQIRGNIHGVTNPNDPVLGYVSASSVQELRTFIDNRSLPGWKSNPSVNCPITIIPTDPQNTLRWNYADTSKDVYYFNTGNPPTMNITNKDCLDCRYQGGTNIQPPFWH
jgi:Domain of unknown function (DUF4249)